MMKSLREAVVGLTAAGTPIIARKRILPTSITTTTTGNTTTSTMKHLPHYMDIVRWHMDIRQHASLLLLHDLGTTGASWGPFSRSIAQLPQKGLSPTMPLQIYMPDLRNHGKAMQTPRACLGDYVEDVVNFAETIIEPNGPLHVVGLGFGGRLALLSALALPGRINSVTVLSAQHDVFAPIVAPTDKLTLLQKVASECRTLQEAEERLAMTIKDECERRALLMNIVQERQARDKHSMTPTEATHKLVARSNISAILELFGNPQAEGTGWPALTFGNGEEGAAAEVMASLGKDTTQITCQIFKNSTSDENNSNSSHSDSSNSSSSSNSTTGDNSNGATAATTTAEAASPIATEKPLSTLFASHRITDVSVPLGLGVVRSEDADVLVQQVLQGLDLLGPIPSENAAAAPEEASGETVSA